MVRRTFPSLCCLWLAWLLPGVGQAGGEAFEALTRASRLFDQMEYPRALDILENVLRLATEDPGDLVEAYRLQGLCYAAQGRTKPALEAFGRLLSLKPDYRPSAEISPRLTSVFAQALEQTRGQPPLSLAHQPPAAGGLLPGAMLKVEFQQDPHQMMREIRVWLIDEADHKVLLRSVSVTRAEATGTISLRLPWDLTGAQARYFVEAINEHGGVLLRLGSEREPFVLRSVAGSPAEGPPLTATSDLAAPSPWYRSWWVWTLVGVVVTGATVGAVIGAQQSRAEEAKVVLHTVGPW